MSRVILEALRSEVDDERLLELLFEELERQLPAELHANIETFLAALAKLPAGLRAMAATHQLDVSLTLDDIGWHFANWPHHGYCAETSRGLRELGEFELAEAFDAAYEIARRHWDRLCEPSTFRDTYWGSELERELQPYNDRLRALAGSSDPQPVCGIYRFWIAYARRHPERLAHEA